MIKDNHVPWPPVEYESGQWAPLDPELYSRRKRLRHDGPYLASVTPKIHATPLNAPQELLALLDEATQELTRFDTEAGALVAPFTSVLLRTESASSSQIENLTSSAKQVALAELGAARSKNAELVVANVRATEAAIKLSGNLDEQAIIEMQRALLEVSEPNLVGGWRTEQVWIGGEVGPHTAEFVPPLFERVPAAISDLVSFIRREDLPTLAHIALAHAQFETIHPFPDGNGRTGRALVQAMMVSKGVTHNITVPISAGLLADVKGYFAALGEYRRGNAGPIIEAFAAASLRAVTNGRQLQRDLMDVQVDWIGRLSGVRSDAAARRAIPHLLAHPVIDVKTLAQAVGVTPPAANSAAAVLEQRGILVPEAPGRQRDRFWSAPQVLEALDRFGARAKRGRASSATPRGIKSSS